MTDGRTREARILKEAAQRRRRDDTTIDGGQRLKLAIPPEVARRLKDEGRTPRWVTKDSARMLQLTRQDDYDPVDGVAPVPTRSLADGSRVEMILLSKPTAFIEEDRAKAEVLRREKEQATALGLNPDDPITGRADFYADPANSISRGGRTPP